MAIETLYPAIRPSLNLDFAGSKTLDPRITFTRASAATYYDGKTVAKAEENLLLRSQEFDQAPWVVNAAGVATAPVRTANYGVAPDGTSTGDRAVFSLNGGTTATDLAQVMQNIAVTFGATYTFSVWAKATDGASSYSIQLAGPGAATSMAVTGTWTRFSVTGTASGASFDLQIRLRGGQTPATSDSADILLWGSQLEQRSQVTAYTPTTTQPITNYIPVLQTAPAGVPRFDHNPVTGESLGLLVEEQRTNLLTYSEQFADTSWLKTGSSISANTVIAPDGTLTADTILATDTNTYLYRNNLLTSGVTYTLSMCLKAGSSSTGGLYASGVACVAIFNLAAGTVTSVTNGSATITPIGNSFYRCSITFTAVTGSNVGYFVAGTSVGSSVHAWGAQLEAGNFPTSYIKTEAGQVTRAADSAQMTGANFSSWYRQDEGSFSVDAVSYAVTNAAKYIFNANDGTAANRLAEYLIDAQARVIETRDGTVEAVLQITTPTNGKSALRYAKNDSLLVGGNSASLDSNNTAPLVSKLDIGHQLTASQLSGYIKRITYYPKRLSDAQLQALTA